jgi:hypothetical protein
MSQVSPSSNIVEDLVARGSITADDVLQLRRAVFANGVVERAEAEAVFRLDRVCSTKAPEWARFYVDALTDFFVWQTEPRGYVDQDLANFLAGSVLHDEHIDSTSELELLINVVHWAVSCPAGLSLLVLKAVKESVLTPETASYGSNRPPKVISPADVEIMRRAIYAPGSPGGFTVTREEAELMFALSDATADSENAPSWDDLFAKAVANYLMFPRGAPVVPSAEEVKRRERWLQERRGVGALLMDVAKESGRSVGQFAKMDLSKLGDAYEDVDPFGRVADRKAQEQEAGRVREALSREAIDEGEANWLIGKINADGMVHENERALLRFIKENSPSIHPALSQILEKAGL